MQQHPVSSYLRGGPGPHPQPGPTEAGRQKDPNISIPGLPRSLCPCCLLLCLLPSTALSMVSAPPGPRGGEHLSGTGEGWRGPVLLPEVLQRLTYFRESRTWFFFSASARALAPAGPTELLLRLG